MTAAQHRLTVETRGPGLVEVTRPIAEWVGSRGGDGLLTVFIRHTSASLLIQENADPDVRTDLHAFLRRLAPHANRPEMDWITHRLEGPDDMPAHLKAAVLPVSLSVPVTDGQLGLGRWQGIYLVEHRDRPHEREILLHLQ